MADFVDMGTFATRLMPQGNLAEALSARTGKTDSQNPANDPLRKKLGEFVGGVFYGTILKQMYASKLKGEYGHGGRGEEVFQGQLGIELAKSLGASASDPVTNKLYSSFKNHYAKAAAGEQPASNLVEVEG